MNLGALTGYRTIIVAVAVILYGVTAAFGVNLPASDNSVSLSIAGVLMLAMRLITRTPPGNGG